MNTIVQISLDVTSLEEAIDTADLAMRAGVDWLEAGTPLILAGRVAVIDGGSHMVTQRWTTSRRC